MLKAIIATSIIALSSTLAFAADDQNVTGKAMQDHPGTTGGSTGAPTSKPSSGSLSEKQMQNQPGVNSDKSGSTATPNAKPSDSSLSEKEMKDAPGAQK